MRVSDILKSKGTAVCTIGPDATIADAVRALHQFGIGAIVVSSDGSIVEGILSERDIVRALHSEGAGVRDRLVSELMTDEVVTCSPGEQVDYMMAVMTQKRFRHAPVVESGKLAGIISIGDVVATRVAELEREAEALEQYIQYGR